LAATATVVATVATTARRRSIRSRPITALFLYRKELRDL
jgi:hypothetical protein